MNPELLDAYRRTSFFVDAPSGGRISIRIGQHAPAIDALLTSHGKTTWAYVTAYNPGSIQVPAEENAERYRWLSAVVAAAGWPMIPGEGVGDDGNWPPEPSLLVLGISRDAAMALAAAFGQIGFVYGTVGGQAELIVLTPGTSPPPPA